MDFWMEKLFNDLTDGSELGIDTPGIQIAHTVCDYCGKEVIGVWDDHIKSSRGLPYQGWVARTPRSGSKNNRYPYKSRTIAEIKAYYRIGEEDEFTITKGNNLLNVCGKVHILAFDGKNWKLRPDLSYESPANTRILCNKCFKETNDCRIAIMGTEGLMYSVSIRADMKEDIQEKNKGEIEIRLLGAEYPLPLRGTILGAHLAPSFGIAKGWCITDSGKIEEVPGGGYYNVCITEKMSDFEEKFKKHYMDEHYIILPKEVLSEEYLKEVEDLWKISKRDKYGD